jgi:hypothetical protein
MASSSCSMLVAVVLAGRRVARPAGDVHGGEGVHWEEHGDPDQVQQAEDAMAVVKLKEYNKWLSHQGHQWLVADEERQAAQGELQPPLRHIEGHEERLPRCVSSDFKVGTTYCPEDWVRHGLLVVASFLFSSTRDHM